MKCFGAILILLSSMLICSCENKPSLTNTPTQTNNKSNNFDLSGYEFITTTKKGSKCYGKPLKGDLAPEVRRLNIVFVRSDNSYSVSDVLLACPNGHYVNSGVKVFTNNIITKELPISDFGINPFIDDPTTSIYNKYCQAYVEGYKAYVVSQMNNQNNSNAALINELDRDLEKMEQENKLNDINMKLDSIDMKLRNNR